MDESINRFKLLSFNLHLMAVIIVWSLVVIIIYSMITGNDICKIYFCCCHHRKMSEGLLKNTQWHHAYKCSKNEVIRHKYPVVHSYKCRNADSSCGHSLGSLVTFNITSNSWQTSGHKHVPPAQLLWWVATIDLDRINYTLIADINDAFNPMKIARRVWLYLHTTMEAMSHNFYENCSMAHEAKWHACFFLHSFHIVGP